MTTLVLWAILAFSLALLGSNQTARHEGIEQALTYVALSSAFVIFVSKLLTVLR